MPVLLRLTLGTFLLFIAFHVSAQTGLVICANPHASCQNKTKQFAPYELSFKLPARLRQNYDYKTTTFYAVILKIYKDFEPGGEGCDGGEFSTAIEAERAKAQKLFPDQKAFASYQCPDMGAVLYKSGAKDLNDTFLAVYGGTTLVQAQTILAKAKVNFPDATLKRMVAVFNWQVE